MAKWIDYSVDERGALIAKVAKTKNIDQTAAEKDWWVTAVLYAVGTLVPIESLVLRLAFRTVLLAIFLVYLFRHDLPLREIPVLNRFVSRS